MTARIIYSEGQQRTQARIFGELFGVDPNAIARDIDIQSWAGDQVLHSQSCRDSRGARMSLMCITNQMPEIRSCTIRDEHQIICDGKEYRFVDKRHREETTGRECRGCLPREAKKGLLCWPCWERVEQAFADWTAEKAGLMASIDRAVQRDTGGRSSGPEGYVPIPGTVLAVEEIRSYLKSGNGLSADLWVSSEVGAMDAIRFARAVPAALRTHELEEKAHKIRRTRCAECRQLTLVWNPPKYSHDAVTVTCSNPECGAQLDQGSFAMLAQIEETNNSNRKASA